MVEPLSGTLAPPWVFVRTSPFSLEFGRNPRRTFRSPHPTAGFTYDRSLRARSPFTRPCRSFCCAYAELIRDQTPPDDFCNCYYDVRATKPVGSRFLAGTVTSITFLFFSHHAAHCWAVMRGEPRYVHFRRSRCWFLPVTQVCPAAISSRAPHHRRVAPVVHSEDQRARVEGPSEGRVPIRMQRCPVRASGSYAYVA